MTVRLVTHKFSVADYYRMTKAGILKKEDRVELIEGDIVQMAAVGSRHFAAVNRLNSLLSEMLRAQAIVSIQMPVLLDDASMPEPDVSLLVPRPDFYAGGLPTPKDVLLLIEVADSSLEYDRLVKMRLYASAGVREYWLVDLVQSGIDVHRQPSATGYAETIRVERSGLVSPLAFPDVNIRVEEVIG